MCEKFCHTSYGLHSFISFFCIHDIMMIFGMSIVLVAERYANFLYQLAGLWETWAPSTDQLPDQHLTLQDQNNSPGLRLWACSTLSVEVNFLQLLSPVQAQGRQYSPAGWGCLWERTGHTFSYQLAVLLAVGGSVCHGQAAAWCLRRWHWSDSQADW